MKGSPPTRRISRAPRTRQEVRISIELRDLLAKQAEEQNRSLNNYICTILEDHALAMVSS